MYLYKMVKDQILFPKDKDIHSYQLFWALYWWSVQQNKKMQIGKEVYLYILQWTIQKWKILIYNSIKNKKYLWINMTKDI